MCKPFLGIDINNRRHLMCQILFLTLGRDIIMKKTTEILIQLPESKTLMNLINEDLPQFEVRPKSTPNIWEFRNNNYIHSLYYNSTKSSTIISKEDKLSKKAIILYVLLLALFGMVIYFKWRNKFDFELSWYLILSTVLTVWIMNKLGLELKQQFEEDHNILVKYFSKFQQD